MKYIKPEWPAPSHIKAFTTVRDGWISREKGTSLKDTLELPDEPVWLNQKHGTNVVEAKLENTDQIADASFSTIPDHVCVTLTADCLPVLITNRKGSHVAAIHAGWRGLAAGVIEETLKTFQLNDELLVWLGPAIGPEKFEVGEDVYQAFTADSPQSKSAFVDYKPGKWLANLYELAKIRLRAQGVNHIYGGDYCTYTQEDLFFSWRRDQDKTGRMASVIWIENMES